MEEQQQGAPIRDWGLTTKLALGGFLGVGLALLLAGAGLPASIFFGIIGSIAFGSQGPEILAGIEDALPKRNQLPRLPERKKAEAQAKPPQDKQTRYLAPSYAHLIDLAPDVQVDKSDLAGKAIFICGIRRHGKTTLGARLAEQLGKHYIPLFIPCLEGDYLSLADVLPRAIVAGHSSADRQYAHYDFIALDTAQEAYELGHTLLKLGYQVILDMASYAVLDQAIAMQINIIRGMFHFANSNPDDRVPAHVFLDEAQRYLPQTLSDSVILDKTVLGELLRAYMDIIAIGGKRGIAPVILTQRFAQVNKKIMAQSEVFFLMRQTNDGDLDRCMEYVSSEIATKEQIAKFQPGQGVYIASDGSQLITHFTQRESSGKRSSTPQADNARRYATMPLIPDEIPSLSKSNGKTAFLPEMEEIRTIQENAVLVSNGSQHKQSESELEKALQAYDEGNTTINALAIALNMSPWNVRPLYTQVKKLRENVG